MGFNDHHIRVIVSKDAAQCYAVRHRFFKESKKNKFGLDVVKSVILYHEERS